MKNILCYGDSNTWGFIPGSSNVSLRLAKRYPYDVRWTGILQQQLGTDYRVIEAGLNGRNTSFDEVNSNRPSRNGLATLPLVMDMNYPLDLVVIMLGTNDTKLEIAASLAQTEQGMRDLIQCVQTSHFGPNFTAPNVMIMVPTPMLQVDADMFKSFYDENSVRQSEQFSDLYKNVAQAMGCYFLDAAAYATVNIAEGIHLDPPGHQALAQALAEKIKSISL